MIRKFKGVSNEKVTVACDESSFAVVVTGYGDKMRMFAGSDDLPEMFESFCKSFSDETSYQDAINYFKPNYKVNFS